MTVLSHDGSNVFLQIISSWGQVFMKKLSMISQVSITFEQGCEKYILNCKQRNLRQGTIRHYKQSYTQFYKYFDREMLLSEITEQTYKDYVVCLCDTIENDVSVNSYLRDLITTFHFWMNEGYAFLLTGSKERQYNLHS